jgi:hypothetical protein
MTDDLRAARARRAAEARAKLVERAKAKEGQPGVTRLRERLYEATHAALRAEMECRDG